MGRRPRTKEANEEILASRSDDCLQLFQGGTRPRVLERNAHYFSGLVTGMSLQKEGPGLHCLSPLLFDYFVAGPSSFRPIALDVTDHDMRKKIEKVQLADTHLHELMITRKIIRNKNVSERL